ncbi:hypothetical protein [Acinetobacter nosocomialis]|uniref:hypothetical protein n=1 Tax=Acinetobacter nosocomialis TaxID=106654 RepID=UPI0019627375|nr:hypothetical protein [Acinetobacter nosocomialis]MBM9552223.1 hypothetical protein [Acinetobacter nosocomialis]MCJ9034929.1 hypothetical protein [Acinetobacter nosocomialis]
MKKSVKRLWAYGSRGSVKGDIFEARKDSNGKYILNLKQSSFSLNPTNKAINKVAVENLTEAYDLLSTDLYSINLTNEKGQRALREYKKVIVEFF